MAPKFWFDSCQSLPPGIAHSSTGHLVSCVPLWRVLQRGHYFVVSPQTSLPQPCSVLREAKVLHARPSSSLHPPNIVKSQSAE